MRLQPDLRLRQGQSLVMTPQLLQAIRLLQMSRLELAGFLEAELEQNPLLTQAEDGVAAAPAPAREPADVVSAFADRDIARAAGGLDADFANVFDSEGSGRSAPLLSADGGWAGLRGSRDIAGSDGDRGWDDFPCGQPSLREHLLAQLTLAAKPPRELALARYLVDCLDEAGYLREDPDLIAVRLGAASAEVEAALVLVQSLEPTGVGARSLSECLALQLKERDRLDPAMATLVANLDRLERRDFAGLKRLCRVDGEDLAAMLAELRRLEPRPGRAFGAEPLSPLVPDILVARAPDGGWQVELNADALPKVLIDRRYHARLAPRLRGDGERAYLATHLQQANWLVRNLDQRARTILKVATEIVRHQDGFLTAGLGQLRPLNLRTLAAAVGLHESTVSRATANKFMATSRGVYELRFFFTQAIAATGGGDAHSAAAVRERIRAMIAAEPADGVLSDDQIVGLLRRDGIEIARRTVAKYREALRIPSSTQRRRDRRAAL